MKKYICQFKKLNPNASFSGGLKTIQTIKILREVTSCGLKRARHVVEGKLALMHAHDVLDFIDLHCEEWDSAKIRLGHEYTVVSSRFVGPAGTAITEPTGYCFVVHREA